MSIEQKPKKEWTPETARNEIMSIRQDIALLGANNSEFSDINQILKDLEKNNILPEEAVHRVYAIQESKSTYH